MFLKLGRGDFSPLLYVCLSMYHISKSFIIGLRKVIIINKIREKRLEKGWTQYKLAEMSGVPQSTICQIENGNRKYPTHENIRKIAKALQINLEELYI